MHTNEFSFPHKPKGNGHWWGLLCAMCILQGKGRILLNLIAAPINQERPTMSL